MFASNEPEIEISYETPNGIDGDIFFRSDLTTAISPSCTDLKCGTSNEDERCKSIRKGNFYWPCTYRINFAGNYSIEKSLRDGLQIF